MYATPRRPTTGPYTLAEDELVLPPFHHNPSVQRAPDGTFLIYCIGARAGACPDGPSGNCTGETSRPRLESFAGGGGAKVTH